MDQTNLIKVNFVENIVFQYLSFKQHINQWKENLSEEIFTVTVTVRHGWA